MKKSGEIWGEDFSYLPGKHEKKSGRISGQISEKISETSFQFSRLFSETSFSRRAVLINFSLREWFTNHPNHIHTFTPITRIVATKLLRVLWEIGGAPRTPPEGALLVGESTLVDGAGNHPHPHKMRKTQRVSNAALANAALVF